jgi:hypothetical protein
VRPVGWFCKDHIEEMEKTLEFSEFGTAKSKHKFGIYELIEMQHQVAIPFHKRHFFIGTQQTRLALILRG